MELSCCLSFRQDLKFAALGVALISPLPPIIHTYFPTASKRYFQKSVDISVA
jgi:hypothetical protein